MNKLPGSDLWMLSNGGLQGKLHSLFISFKKYLYVKCIYIMFFSLPYPLPDPSPLPTYYYHTLPSLSLIKIYPHTPKQKLKIKPSKTKTNAQTKLATPLTPSSTMGFMKPALECGWFIQRASLFLELRKSYCISQNCVD